MAYIDHDGNIQPDTATSRGPLKSPRIGLPIEGQIDGDASIGFKRGEARDGVGGQPGLRCMLRIGEGPAGPPQLFTKSGFHKEGMALPAMPFWTDAPDLSIRWG